MMYSFIAHAHCLCQYRQKGKRERERRGMDTGRSSDDEKRQDASLPYSRMGVSIMRMLSRRIKRFFLFFFFFFSSCEKRKPPTINIFSSLYKRVICLCSYRVWRERRKGKGRICNELGFNIGRMSTVSHRSVFVIVVARILPLPIRSN